MPVSTSSPLGQAERPHPVGGSAARWADRWFALRNRLLASQRFQRWAISFPLTRPVAQRRARELFDLVAGFVYSQVLLACVRLNLFEILSEGPQSLAELARRLGLEEAAAARLLAAAVSLQLVERRGHDHFGLGVLGAPLVGHQALAALIKHHGALYADLADPVALLNGTAVRSSPAQLSNFWPYAMAQAPGSLPGDQVAGYSALMSASQPLVADEILDAYPMGRHRCLLDVGGGEGTFLIRALARWPGLQGMVFDLPAVTDRARTHLAATGLAARTRTVGGDFLMDALPAGADIATLVRVVHDHDDAQALCLLTAVHRALNPGGTLLLAEPMAGTRGAEPVADAYFGFYLFAMGSGRPRTPEQLTQLLQGAGFIKVRLLTSRMPLQTRILIAQAGQQQNGRANRV